ncbi:unnamed protein product [Prunus armeniaca]
MNKSPKEKELNKCSSKMIIVRQKILIKATRPTTLMRIISPHFEAQMLGFKMLTTKKAEVVIKQGRVETTTFLAIDFMQKTAVGLGLSTFLAIDLLACYLTTSIA